MADGELVLQRGLGRSKCRSCKREVAWAYTGGGTKAPFQEDPDGEYVLENGFARHVGKPVAQLELGAAPAVAQTRYTSHFATCPDAPKWRGKK